MAEKTSVATRWNNLRPTKTFLFWACVGSAVVTVVGGFQWGGWVTGNTARSMVENGTSEARAQLAVASCIERFGQGANVGDRLAQLKKTDSWMRGTYMEKAGWVTPVGVKEPVRNAGDRCAEQLLNPKAPATKAAN